MAGEVRVGHVELAVCETATPQMLRPVAIEELVDEQLVGAR
jgi:hypothetical protein